MGTLFLIFMGIVFAFYGYIQVDRFVKKHNKVTTGVIFDAETMPSAFDEAVAELRDGGL